MTKIASKTVLFENLDQTFSVLFCQACIQMGSIKVEQRVFTEKKPRSNLQVLKNAGSLPSTQFGQKFQKDAFCIFIYSFLISTRMCNLYVVSLFSPNFEIASSLLVLFAARKIAQMTTEMIECYHLRQHFTVLQKRQEQKLHFSFK